MSKSPKSVITNDEAPVVVNLTIEEMVNSAIAAIDSIPNLPESMKVAFKANARQTVLDGENKKLTAELETLEARRKEIIQWQLDNGFRNASGSKESKREACACGVGRHTEESPRCETYIAFLNTEIATCKNEIRLEQLRRYLNRETAKEKAEVAA